MSPTGWATGTLSPIRGRQAPIFENFPIRHIFLKFCFFKYKNKKAPYLPSGRAVAQQEHGHLVLRNTHVWFSFFHPFFFLYTSSPSSRQATPSCAPLLHRRAVVPPKPAAAGRASPAAPLLRACRPPRAELPCNDPARDNG